MRQNQPWYNIVIQNSPSKAKFKNYPSMYDLGLGKCYYSTHLN